MTSLVDRYVHTALRRVPEAQRADIDRELRASIEDAVDARTDAGEPREAAVEQTLLELGDPDRLADRYAGRADHLIGPELFPVWRRLVRLMLTAVLPLVIGVMVVVQLLEDPGPALIGEAISAALNVGVHLVFWTTAVVVVLERTGVGPAGLRTTWSLSDLPAYEPGRPSRAELAATLVWPVILIAALVLQQFTFTDVPVLDPANWSFWWPYLIGVLVLEGAYAVWVYRLGRPTSATAVVNAVLALMAAVPLVWLLATDRFVNPAFPAFAGDPAWLDVAAKIGIAVVALSAVWDIMDGFRRVARAGRDEPTKVAGSGSYTFC